MFLTIWLAVSVRDSHQFVLWSSSFLVLDGSVVICWQDGQITDKQLNLANLCLQMLILLESV